jgi:carboxyl-terminal processing protease
MMITKTTGFLKLNRFSAKTSSEFTKETTKLLEAGMKELILDLRDNPGGYLSAAINICDHFIIDGDPIVYTKGRNREETKIVASSSRLLEDIKLVVLINEGSASASEIISGAVQDNDRGTIIGRRSFGKGLVQEEIKLKDGSAIRLTTQRYYTPSGRSIQKSYGGNINEYYLEQYLRNDSILPDSLKFKTKKGRIVFGGGGINPDIIIEKDTFLDYKTINKIIANGWIREFSMKYTDLNRKNIKKITNRKEYINKIEDIIYNQFLAYINKKDSSFNQNIKDEDMKFIKKQVMANISRNLWGNEDYYRIMIDDDKYVKKGLEIMKTLN